MTSRWVNRLVGAARAVLSGGGTRTSGARTRTSGGGTRTPGGGASAGARTPSGGYPGDFRGTVRAEYAPNPDGSPDPGEIVWTWIPYEEDHARGKDRPVLLVGHDGGWLLALQLTSKDHDRDAAQEARAGRVWMDIGSGPWDRQGRPSEIRLNRVIRVAPDGVRREGAVMPKALFRQVVRAMAKARA
ncbi:type II toxin-antitoxin system PemK/MazF family toxin [Xylanimonas sp. McL0601]|uniref:type II toxin-antitoxin system PemK/MazF family toxin n=1 Tax=Xylanimonas sp. McL0601 TaxID=3414739 RepID=UPI003CF60890